MTFLSLIFARVQGPAQLSHSPVNRNWKIVTTCTLISNSKSDGTSVMTAPNSIFDSFSSRGERNRPWINVARLHHALLGNHFVDLLDLYSADHGLAADEGPSYAVRMRALSSEFRRHVLGALTRAIGPSNVVAVPADSLEDGAKAARQVTLTALQNGVDLLVNPVLADESARIIARPPALLRADLVQRILNINLEDLSLDGSSYIPLAVKRSAVQTVRGGEKLKPSVMDRLQAEATLWATMLEAHLKTSIPIVAVIGLAPNRKRPVAAGANVSPDAIPPFNTGVWKAAAIDVSPESISKQRAINALKWRVDAVDEGATWLSEAVLAHRALHSTDPISPFHALAANPQSSHHRPNMKIAEMYDWPWADTKRAIAESVGELTLISGVGNNVVEEALQRNLPNNYRDERITSESLGITRLLTERSIVMSKPDYNGPVVLPKYIQHNQGNWRLLEDYSSHDETKFNNQGKRIDRWDERSFFVDFELVSPDALHSLPTTDELAITEVDKELAQSVDLVAAKPFSHEHRAEPLIFIIGCGRIIQNKWEYNCFTARSLNVKSEQEILLSWMQFMSDALRTNEGETPYVFVWGPEQQLLRKAMKRMQSADEAAMRDIVQCKMINVFQIVTGEGLTIQGNLKHSIKSVAKALEEHNLLQKVDGAETRRCKTLNGMDSMAVILDLIEASSDQNVHSVDGEKGLKDVQTYNEIDCLDIARIISYLRDNH